MKCPGDPGGQPVGLVTVEGDPNEALRGNLVEEVQVSGLNLGGEGTAVDGPQGELLLTRVVIDDVTADLTIELDTENGAELAVHEVSFELIIVLVPGEPDGGKLGEVWPLLLKGCFFDCHDEDLLEHFLNYRPYRWQLANE